LDEVFNGIIFLLGCIDGVVIGDRQQIFIAQEGRSIVDCIIASVSLSIYPAISNKIL
jgi:hypothetical protein